MSPWAAYQVAVRFGTPADIRAALERALKEVSR